MIFLHFVIIVLPDKMIKAIETWKKIEHGNPEQEISTGLEKYNPSNPRYCSKLSEVIHSTMNSLMTSHLNMPSYGTILSFCLYYLLF